MARRTDDPDRELSPGQVAGHLAEYATRSAADTTDTDTDEDRPYELLGKWSTCVGFAVTCHQVAPLLDHPRRPPPGPSSHPSPHRVCPIS
jgi:hypothetical protein